LLAWESPKNETETEKFIEADRQIEEVVERNVRASSITALFQALRLKLRDPAMTEAVFTSELVSDL